MELRAKRYADVLVLQALGRVDHLNAESFGALLAPHLENCREGGDRLLLDLGDLEYISSAGLRVLMLATKRVTPAGGRIALAAASPLVAEILQISRFNLIFPIHPSVPLGLAELSPAAAQALGQA